MRLLHRYILRELLGPAILGLVVFTFVLLLQQIFDIIDLMMRRGVQGITVVQVFGCLIPQVLVVTAPMAVLVAALLSFGRLATDREVMAMRASGIRILWLVSPALWVGLIVSVILLAMNLTVMPRLATQLQDLKYQLIFQTITGLEPGRLYDDFSSGGREMQFTYEERGEERGQLRSVVIHSEFEDPATLETRLIDLVARGGTIRPDQENRVIRVSLEDGTVHLARHGAGESSLREIRYERLEQSIQPELRRFRRGRYVKSASQMSGAELSEAIERERDGGRLADLRVELHRRWVFPFSALAFIMIGIPFGIVTRASGKGFGLAISFALILVYYGLLEWGTAMVEAGSGIGPLAMWSPNIVLGFIGGTVLWWVSRR